MTKIHRSAVRMIVLGSTMSSLCLALVAGLVLCPSAVALSPDMQARLVDSGRVAPGLIERLAEVDRVGARVLFTVPGDTESPAPIQSQVPEDVDPVVVDLAQYFLPGSEMSIGRSEVVRSLTGVVDGPAVLGFLQNRHVLAVELEDGLVAEEERQMQNLSAGSHTSCGTNSTTICVQSNRFSMRVSKSGIFQTRSFGSGESGVFFFTTSGNLEVLSKVLNGCGINNRYWVFAAGATTQSFTLHVEDFSTHATKSYGPQCPLVDTSAFAC